MKYLKYFENQNDFQTYMASEELSLPNVSFVNNGNINYHDLLPNIDTTNYATTFVNGQTYEKEGKLFKMIVENFIQQYSPDEEFNDNTWIDIDLENATIESHRYNTPQIFSIADEPLYINYLSKITNFWGQDSDYEDLNKPYGILSFGLYNVSRDQVYIGGINKSFYFSLDYNGTFEETIN